MPSKKSSHNKYRGSPLNRATDNLSARLFVQFLTNQTATLINRNVWLIIQLFKARLFVQILDAKTGDDKPGASVQPACNLFSVVDTGLNFCPISHRLRQKGLAGFAAGLEGWETWFCRRGVHEFDVSQCTKLKSNAPIVVGRRLNELDVCRTKRQLSPGPG